LEAYGVLYDDPRLIRVFESILNEYAVSTYSVFAPTYRLVLPVVVEVTMYNLPNPSIGVAMALMALSDNFAWAENPAALMSPTVPVFSGKAEVARS
jgi:hypothetical protein